MADYNTINIEDLSSQAGGPYEQQTFLGLSITSWSSTASFGDTSSTLSVQLVKDDFNTGDGTLSGVGQDVYHNFNIGDDFAAIPVGSPVFFAFGRERAPVKDAFLHVLDEYYGSSISQKTFYYAKDDPEVISGSKREGSYKSGTRGHYHFTFGGILQAYNQSLSAEGASSYQVQVTDPREILSNLTLILNGYSGGTILPNIMNIYGLLEHNPNTPLLREKFEPDYAYNRSNVDILAQNADGDGTDMYYHADSYSSMVIPATWSNNVYTVGLRGDSRQFPITGTGWSKRNNSGIPYYRVVQAINTLLGYNGGGNPIFNEYYSQSYYNKTLFRGLKYAIDISGLPKLSYAHMINYDQMTMLEFALEVCELANHELYVELLPIIDHPYTRGLYYQNLAASQSNPQDMFVAMIALSSINKSSPPTVGKILEYIQNLPTSIQVIDKDVGYELSNDVIDKFIIGGNTVDMHLFPSNHLIDGVGEDKMQLTQQIVPYYGLINEATNAVTIPKGIGSYSQILLDASNLFAEGIGNTYVATEMELRAAAISYDKWKQFLETYNNLFMESIDQGDIRDRAALRFAIDPNPDANRGVATSQNYAITVPRCLWPTSSDDDKLVDGEPNNPCHPPYGWPLYWHRAQNIGILDKGIGSVLLDGNRIISNFGKIQSEDNQINSKPDEAVRKITKGVNSISAQSNVIARAGMKNAKIIYAFLKKIADECLGKKFLVKIPQRVNYTWNNIYTHSADPKSVSGPFGFKPRLDMLSARFTSAKARADQAFTGVSYITKYLQYPVESIYEGDPDGALKIGYNPDQDALVYNYYPEPQGGFYPYDASWIASSTFTGFYPKDSLFLKGENGRISPYVRFNNTENLDFSSISSSELSRQVINIADGSINPDYIPDEQYNMEGGSTPRDIYPGSPGGGLKTTRSVHFVKVSLDENFYLAPKTKSGMRKVFGRSYAYTEKTSEASKVYDPEDCKEKDSYRTLDRFYYPVEDSGTDYPVSPYIDLDDPGADYQNGVYALITIPGRVISHKSSRMREGIDMMTQNTSVKHLLQADVYKYVFGFDSPPVNQTIPQDRSFSQRLHPSGLSSDARALIRKSYQGLNFSLNDAISLVSPSPIYPDLVVLPLRSEERCYGPWSTLSESSPTNIVTPIGGKVEVIKDENLAPWNFAGYTYMTQQAETTCLLGAGSLLLSERGAFSMIGTPSGISLGSYLLDSGPLVTDVNVSFDATGAAKTSLKMDSYTVSFGKMQKQRSDQIKRLSRERQKTIDQNNKEARRRSGKNQKDISFGILLKGLEDKMNSMQHSAALYESLKPKSNYADIISAAVGMDDVNGQTKRVSNTSSSIQSLEDTDYAAELLAQDERAAAHSYSRSADEIPEDSKFVVSHEPANNLPFFKGRPDYPHHLAPEVDDNTSRWS